MHIVHPGLNSSSAMTQQNTVSWSCCLPCAPFLGPTTKLEVLVLVRTLYMYPCTLLHCCVYCAHALMNIVDVDPVA